MKKLDENEFANLFYTNIYQTAKIYEEKRKKLNFRKNVRKVLPILTFCSPFLGGILVAIFMFICFLFNIEYRREFDIFLITCALSGWGLAVLLFPITAFLFNNNDSEIKELKTEVKQSIIIKLLEYIGIEYVENGFDINIASPVLSQLGLDYAEIDDVIKGEYNTLPFIMIDYNRASELGYKYRRDGLLFATKINKVFTGDTIINSSFGTYYPSLTGCKKTLVEDVEFNSMFTIYTNEEIDTRYLPTPTFLERFKEFQKKKSYNIRVYFTRKTYMDSNIFFLVNSYRDFFDIDIGRSFLNKDNYYSIYKDIFDFLEIAEILKLNQNIGL